MGAFFKARIVAVSSISILSFSMLISIHSSSLYAADLLVDVPCSDETKADDPSNPSDLRGKPEFGQKSCGTSPTTGIKGQIKKNLSLLMGHIIKYYYDGYQVDFTDTNDPKNKDKGFCKVKNITQPVCEIQNSEITQNNYNTGSTGKCGYKPTSLSSLQNVDFASCFKSIPTDATVCGSPLYKFAESELADVIVKRDAAKQNLDAATTPVAKALLQPAFDQWNDILTKPAAKQAYLTSIWAVYAAQDNSEYCLFRKNGMDEQTCGKEMAWIRGFRVSFWKQNLQKVQDEVDTGKLTVLDHGNNALPCKPLSDAVAKLLDGNGTATSAGIRSVESQIRAKWGVASADLGTDSTMGALGLEGTELSSVGDALSQTQLKINQNYTTGSEGIEKFDKHVSNAVMSLGLARRRVESLFTKLAQCEVIERTNKDLSTLMKSGSGGFFGQMNAAVITPCKNYANANASSESDGWNKFYQCYRNGVNGVGNVQKFFQSISQSNFTYDAARAPAVKSLKIADRAVANAQGYQIVAGGQEVNIADVPYCKELNAFDPSLVGL